jgi:hypothetical protein
MGKTVPKIQIVILKPAKNFNLKDVILSEAKNLTSSFQIKKSKKRSFDLRMTER